LLCNYGPAVVFRGLAGVWIGGAICGVVLIVTRVLAVLSCDL
jgi:hypothetical protein